MRKNTRIHSLIPAILAGLVVGLLTLLVTVQFAAAAEPRQDSQPAPRGEGDAEFYTTQECQECHLDVSSHWESSPHANAFSDPVFQERWIAMNQESECLACHTTDFVQSTGEFDAEGISCQACHGHVSKNHPPEPAPILADTNYCGTCHTTTLGEWRMTGHATADIGCSGCHDPHSQQALFDNPDDMCLNCHEDSMGDYLEDTHHSKGIGCVDCHALVIPPDPLPVDGIVPTGHAFTITPATCVACHTDALHAGFSLPGYEEGASQAVAAHGDGDAPAAVAGEEEEQAGESVAVEEEPGLSPDQQIQTLEAALANQNATTLFQGGLIGLVLGGSTAWIVANNTQARRKNSEAEAAVDDEEKQDE